MKKCFSNLIRSLRAVPAMLLLFSVFCCASVLLEHAQCRSARYLEETGCGWIRLYAHANLADLYSEDGLANFKSLHTALTAQDGLRGVYYEMHNQPVELIGPQVADAAHAESVQISHNVQSRYALAVQQGSLLSKAAFMRQGDEPVPVLLGAAYANRYAPGDKITIRYIFHPFTLTVNGILEQGMALETPMGLLTLDSAIVMPSFALSGTPASQEDTVFWVRHYANRLGGWYEYPSAADAEAFQARCASLSAKPDTSSIVLETTDLAFNRGFTTELLACLFGYPVYFDINSLLFLLLAGLTACCLPLLFAALNDDRSSSGGHAGAALYGRYLLSMLAATAPATVALFLLRRVLTTGLWIYLPALVVFAALLGLPVCLLCSPWRRTKPPNAA